MAKTASAAPPTATASKTAGPQTVSAAVTATGHTPSPAPTPGAPIAVSAALTCRKRRVPSAAVTPTATRASPAVTAPSTALSTMPSSAPGVSTRTATVLSTAMIPFAAVTRPATASPRATPAARAPSAARANAKGGAGQRRVGRPVACPCELQETRDFKRCPYRSPSKYGISPTQGSKPSESVFKKATMAASSSGVRPRSPNSSWLTVSSTSGGGQQSAARACASVKGPGHSDLMSRVL